MSRSHLSDWKVKISHVENLPLYMKSIGLLTFYIDLPPQKEVDTTFLHSHDNIFFNIAGLGIYARASFECN